MSAPVSPLRHPTYYCTKCGSEAKPLEGRPSLDPRCAIASCSPCGRMKLDQFYPAEVYAVADEATAVELVRVNRIRREIELHRGHDPLKPVKACPHCGVPG